MRTIKNLSGLKYIFLTAAVAWTLTVAVLCLVTFSALPAIAVDGFDKLGHIMFHLGIVSLWYLYFVAAYKHHRVALLRAALFSLVFGILMELLQGSLTETRSADINDVFANAAGAVAAISLITVIKMYWSRSASE